MGEPSPVINHFSHGHSLQLANYQQTHNTSTCSGCNLSLVGWIYACNPCNYSIHLSCCQAPQLIHHQAHQHPLHLILSPPYQNKRFTCNICRNMGSNHWLYRCATPTCNFDAHLGCARGTPPNSLAQAPPFQAQYHQHQMPPTAAPQFQAPMAGYPNGMVQQNYPPNNYANGQGNTWGDSLAQGLVEGAAEGVGRAAVQGLTAGGGGSGGGGGGGGSGGGGGATVASSDDDEDCECCCCCCF